MNDVSDYVLSITLCNYTTPVEKSGVIYPVNDVVKLTLHAEGKKGESQVHDAARAIVENLNKTENLKVKSWDLAKKIPEIGK